MPRLSLLECVCEVSVSRSVVSDSAIHGLYSPWNSPGSRILEWVAVPFSRGFSQCRDWTQFSHIAGRFFTCWATREACVCLETFQKTSIKMHHLGIQFNLKALFFRLFVLFYLFSHYVWLFCNPMDCSLPDFSVHVILQARILECVAISFSRWSSRPREQTHIPCIGRWILYCWATRKAQSEGWPEGESASKPMYMDVVRSTFLKAAGLSASVSLELILIPSEDY